MINLSRALVEFEESHITNLIPNKDTKTYISCAKIYHEYSRIYNQNDSNYNNIIKYTKIYHMNLKLNYFTIQLYCIVIQQDIYI